MATKGLLVEKVIKLTVGYTLEGQTPDCPSPRPPTGIPYGHF